jgi:hypothetical protein
LQSRNLLGEILEKLKNESSDELVTVILDKIAGEKWPSVENIILIAGMHGEYSKSDFLLDKQRGHGIERLIRIAVSLCMIEDDRTTLASFCECAEFVEAVRKLIVKEKISPEYTHSFYSACRHFFEQAYNRKYFEIDYEWTTELLKFHLYKLDTLVVNSRCWKKLNQSERTACLCLSGRNWSLGDRFIYSNNMVGTIKWQEMSIKGRLNYCRIQIDSSEFHKSLFIFEVDKLGRKKQLSEKDFAGLYSALSLSGTGVSNIKVMFVLLMTTCSYAQRAFACLPSTVHFELLHGDYFEPDVIESMSKYCSMSLSDWLKVKKKRPFISNDIIIENTDWDKESPRMIKKAEGFFA